MDTVLILSNEEDTILLLLADGYSTQDICDWFEMPRSTCISKLATIRKKLGAKTNPHAVALAYHKGILRPKING